ncbi:MAG: HEAT repeat domain-containing protein [Verrucomicrobia bacterium]|nr:HEAT repeat domain-containing protein [Verrucomicrobiota bacterium]
MKNREFSIEIGIVALLVGLFVFVLLSPVAREPVYQGKPLKVWLEAFDQNYQTTNYIAAQAAIRAMGTNTLPFLIRYLRSKDPPFHIQVVRWRAKLHLLGDKVDYATFWHRRAATACGELGADGEAAFPAMVEAMNDYQAASDVGDALSRMMPKSVPVLTNVLLKGNVTARCRAADALTTAFSLAAVEEMGRTALLNALNDPDPGPRATAASAFQFWNTRLDLIVPVLARALSDPDPSVRGNAATSLGNFGNAARPAVPMLLKLLQDTNDYPRKRSAEMLLKIDPDAASKAGVK